MSYQPPYTITSSIVSLVADISERMGYLSALESESRTLPPKSPLKSPPKSSACCCKKKGGCIVSGRTRSAIGRY